MAALKYSKQREAIKDFLAHSHEHPTADVVYMNLRESFPNISLGTVYRNLSLLSEMGQIQKISMRDGADRFDGTITPHDHFICEESKIFFWMTMKRSPLLHSSILKAKYVLTPLFFTDCVKDV